MESISFLTLTPVWTGNIDKESSILRATGILGSLRWWTEAILRGMGYYCCDPTNNFRCPKETQIKREKAPIEKKKEFCNACLIFGATGLSRSFKIETININTNENSNNNKKEFFSTAINLVPGKRKRGWRFMEGINGNITLRFTSLFRYPSLNLVLFPLVIATNWGAIGAKTQLGYGVISLINSKQKKVTTKDFLEELERISERLSTIAKGELRKEESQKIVLPNIQKFFFTKIQFDVLSNEWWQKVMGIKKLPSNEKVKNWAELGYVPTMPALKNWMRYSSSSDSAKEILFNGKSQHKFFQLFGGIKNSSKINISWAYRVKGNKWEFRIWGWLPARINGLNREEFLSKLKIAIDKSQIPWVKLFGEETSNFKLIAWREYNSTRDTVKKFRDINKYLDSLI